MTDAPKTYTIKTPADFLMVPEERLSDCLHEFAVWLALIRYGVALADKAGARVRPLPFEWIDDGVADAGLTIIDGQTSTVITSGKIKPNEAK